MNRLLLLQALRDAMARRNEAFFAMVLRPGLDSIRAWVEADEAEEVAARAYEAALAGVVA